MKRFQWAALLCLCLWVSGCAAGSDIPAADTALHMIEQTDAVPEVCVIRRKEHWQILPLFFDKNGSRFLKSVNALRDHLGEYIRIYVVPVPLSSLCYLPERYEKNQIEQQDYISRIKKERASGVTVIKADEIMKRHQDKDLFLRTDRGLTPLGAYELGAALCKAAGLAVPAFEKGQVLSGNPVCGALCEASGDPRLEEDPEVQETYLPSVSVRMDYYDKTMRYRRTVTSTPKDKTPPAPPGKEEVIIKITAGKADRRKLLVLQDRVGGTILPILTGSFTEIYAMDIDGIDCDLTKFVIEKHITDVALLCSVDTASTGNFSTLENWATKKTGAKKTGS